MEPRRVVLAVVLMAAVLIASSYFFPTAPTVAKNGAAVTDTLAAGASASAVPSTAATPNATTPATASASPPPGAPATVGDSAALAAAPAAIAIDTTVVNTARAVFRTSNRGATLVSAEMTDYKALRDRGRVKGENVELANPGQRLLGFRLVPVPGDTVRLDTTVFRSARTEEGGVTNVTYSATVRDRAVSIVYSFLPDSYRVNVAARVEGAPSNSYLLVDLPQGFRSSEADPAEDQTHLAYAYKEEAGGADGIGFGSLDPGEKQIESGPLSWVVAKNKYFVFGVLVPKGRPGFAELNVTGGIRDAKAATRADATAIMPLTNGEAALEIYAGPQEFKRLVAMGREFETSNPYGGWLQGMVQPFATMVIRALLWMKATLGLSYGWILVLFGVAVRIILWPLNQRAMRSSMAMQRIQPELQALQAKHKGDPQKLQAEMMKLYKEHDMSPFSSLSGCLPMLIPLPIFFALFFVFQNTIEFRGVSFLWLPDISIKDPFYVLPVLVAITAMILSYIGMKGIKGNDQQKMMMYMMPAMMLFIFLNMASGLNLYYLVQNLASLPQQWLIAHERGKQTPLVRG
ncbi:MAG: membrane protein insertase YidC [Gemmatimonadota bacterium]